MAIELKDYDVISNDFELLTGKGLFIDLAEIPLHHKSAMHFTLTIGRVGRNSGSDFSMNVSVDPKFRHSKQGYVSPGSFEYGEFDRERILKDIKDLIASCDHGDFDDSINALRKVLSWEYEGMAAP